MNEIRDFAAQRFSTSKVATRATRHVQSAPGAEQPHRRDKAGAQLGMLIMILGGAAFWAAVAGLVVYLLK